MYWVGSKRDWGESKIYFDSSMDWLMINEKISIGEKQSEAKKKLNKLKLLI